MSLPVSLIPAMSTDVAAADYNPHAAIVARHAAKRAAEREKQEKELPEQQQQPPQAAPPNMKVNGVPVERDEDEEERPGEAEKSALQQQIVEKNLNPHAAIIARHAARKAEKEKEDRVEQERLDREQRGRDAKVTKLESEAKQQQEAVQRAADLLSSSKPLEPRIGELMRYEGGLKGWKSRLCVLEDKLPLTLLVYKQNRNDGEFLDGYELTSEVVLEEDGLAKWGSLSSLHDDSSKSTISSRKSAKGRTNQFTVTIRDKVIKLACDSTEGKDEWISYFQQVLQKHHGLARSMADKEVQSPPPLFKKTHAKTGSSGSGKLTTKSTDKRKGSISTFEEREEALINPLDDEDMVGKSFKNALFDE